LSERWVQSAKMFQVILTTKLQNDLLTIMDLSSSTDTPYQSLRTINFVDSWHSRQPMHRRLTKDYYIIIIIVIIIIIICVCVEPRPKK
jgi:hypothetical protein